MQLTNEEYVPRACGWDEDLSHRTSYNYLNLPHMGYLFASFLFIRTEYICRSHYR